MKLWKKQGEDSPVEAGADRALPTTDGKGKKPRRRDDDFDSVVGPEEAAPPQSPS